MFIIRWLFGPTSPWRKFEEDIWTDKVHVKLLDDLENCFRESESVKSTNILFLGPTTSGKSSFVSSILSIGGNTVLDPAEPSPNNTSCTTKLGCYKGRLINIGPVKLYDTMGVQDGVDNGIRVDDVELLLEGHISEDYEFKPKKRITTEDKEYIAVPKASDRINLVVFCIDAKIVMKTDVPRDLLKKVDQIRKKAKQLGLRRVLLLTHVDEISDAVSKDIKKVFHCRKVYAAVCRARDLFQIPESFIHPVENYHNVSHTSKMKNVHLMLALQHMLENANDCAHRMSNTEKKTQTR